MFHLRRLELARRQATLIATSGSLRERFAMDAQELAPPLAIADRVRNGFRWLLAHPQWIAVAVAASLVFRTRRTLGWGLRLWTGWRILRRVKSLIGSGGGL